MRANAPAPKLPAQPPATGELVHVRSRRWLVEEVVEPPAPGESAIVRLACAEDDSQGQTLSVFWDYELDRRILEDEGWADLAARGFDSPRQFAAEALRERGEREAKRLHETLERQRDRVTEEIERHRREFRQIAID